MTRTYFWITCQLGTKLGLLPAHKLTDVIQHVHSSTTRRTHTHSWRHPEDQHTEPIERKDRKLVLLPTHFNLPFNKKVSHVCELRRGTFSLCGQRHLRPPGGDLFTFVAISRLARVSFI